MRFTLGGHGKRKSNSFVMVKRPLARACSLKRNVIESVVNRASHDPIVYADCAKGFPVFAATGCAKGLALAAGAPPNGLAAGAAITVPF
jgi:hypothetical protein